MTDAMEITPLTERQREFKALAATMVSYDARWDVFWEDEPDVDVPWEYRIPVCIARPAKVL